MHLRSLHLELLTSVMRGQCDEMPMVTFPAAVEHNCLVNGTKLCCSVTETRVCDHLPNIVALKWSVQESNFRDTSRMP